MASKDNSAGASRRVPDNTSLEPGEKLWVEWGGDWYEGTVVKVLKNGKVKIHYVGWDDTSDEVVTRDRLRLGAPPDGAILAGAGTSGATGTPPVFESTEAGILFGRPVDPETPLTAGDEILILWRGTWWSGSVLRREEPDKVRIHYNGWDNSWDEVVPCQRLRLPASGPCRVTAHLEADWSVTGEVLELTPTSLILKLSGSGQTVVVNRARLAYFEVETGQ